MSEFVENYGDVYYGALSYFGIDSQKLKLIEEMAELTTAILHDRDGRSGNICEEIADVEIVLNQLKIFYNQNGEVDSFKKMKLERLGKTIT
mgnify:CR=1 FL=1